jgi:hypothetical protein
MTKPNQTYIYTVKQSRSNGIKRSTEKREGNNHIRLIHTPCPSLFLIYPRLFPLGSTATLPTCSLSLARYPEISPDAPHFHSQSPISQRWVLISRSDLNFSFQVCLDAEKWRREIIKSWKPFDLSSRLVHRALFAQQLRISFAQKLDLWQLTIHCFKLLICVSSLRLVIWLFFTDIIFSYLPISNLLRV